MICLPAITPTKEVFPSFRGCRPASATEEVITAIKEITEERYDDQLGVLPPTLWLHYGFLLGELPALQSSPLAG
jgi:hypothetical protein